MDILQVKQKFLRYENMFTTAFLNGKYNYAEKHLLTKKTPVYFEDVNVNGLDHLQSEYIKNQLMKRNDTISLLELKKEYFKIIADEKIRSIYPSIKYNELTKKYGFQRRCTKIRKFRITIWREHLFKYVYNFFSGIAI